MTSFLCIVILIFILFFLSKENNKKILFRVGVIILVFYCGLRYPFAFSDLEGYEEYFKYEQFYLTDLDTVNLGYKYLNRVVYWVSTSFQVLCFVIGAIIIGCHVFFIRKYSTNIVLSLFLFVLIPYFFSFCALRQYLAIGFSLFAFHYCIKRNIYYYSLFSIIAFLFHTSSLVFMPVYFIYSIPISKKSKICFFLGAIICMFCFHFLANIFVGSLAYYSDYLQTGEDSSVVRTLMKIYIALVFLMIMKGKAFEKNINFLLLICFVFQIVIYIGGSGIGLIHRLRAFFEICEIVGIPIMFSEIRKIKTSILRYAYQFMMIAYIVLLSISCYNYTESELFTSGYKYFWE